MRRMAILLIGLILTGCAARPHAAVEPEERMDEAVAAALVFDPPVTAHVPPLELPRDLRRRAAVVGFDETITTFHQVRTDDRQTTDFFDRYERRAVSVRRGVSHR